MTMRNLGMGGLAALITLGCARTDGASSSSATAGADEYTKDLDRICHVHEITGKSADLGLQAVSQWLLENIHTVEARQRLAELPQANIPIWLQSLRRDAAARGISPCPFSDIWEAELNSPRK